MRKVIATLLTVLFFHTQAFARSQPSSLSADFNQLASEIVESSLTADQIIERSKEFVANAKSNGVTEQELLKKLSEKMSLQLSPEEIEQSIAELRSQPSELKLQALAQEIVEVQNGDKVFMVLLTFALLSMLWVGIFFILAGPICRHHPCTH
ncbi:MAG: hypothetical protein RJB13_1444 [Pseudomonadota bacterium]